MKANALLSIQIIGFMAIFMTSCSKDDGKFVDVPQPPIRPFIRHVVDSIYTPFFTSGNYNLGVYVSWGYEKGKLSILAPVNGIQLKNEDSYMLSWDHTLDEGEYPIIVIAENSQGTVRDSFVLVSRFGGSFVGTYNYHPDSNMGMSIGLPFYFEPNGTFGYSDRWDYGKSIEGTWHRLSKNVILGSYKKRGQIAAYSFKATVDYDKETGLPVLSGHWYETADTTSGTEKGQIYFNFDWKSEFAKANFKDNHAWDPGSDLKDYPQLFDYLITEDRSKFGGWFIATCMDGPNQNEYRLYLGLDKKIFRGKVRRGDDMETWSWVTDSRIQGTIMEHSEFFGSEDKFITFKGYVSTDWDSIITIKGYWYRGKEVVEGQEAGEFTMINQRWNW